MKVLVDTNVWLDLILRREPHLKASAGAVALLDGPAHTPYVCATTVTTIFYLVQRARDRGVAMGAQRDPQVSFCERYAHRKRFDPRLQLRVASPDTAAKLEVRSPWSARTPGVRAQARIANRGHRRETSNDLVTAYETGRARRHHKR